MENGEVKFIFLTLSQYRGGADVVTKLVGENNPENTVEAIMPFLVNRSSYEKIKDALQDLNLSVEDIETQTV